MLLAALLSGPRLVQPEPAPGPASDDLLPIARAAVSGQPAAIRTLVTAVGGPMLRTVRKVMGGAHPDIDDVLQEAALALLSALPRFRGDCSVVHFAHRVAVLTAMSARRQSRTRQQWSDLDAELEELPEDKQESPWLVLVAAQRRHILRELLDELPDTMAEALALHYMVGYTVDEIASTSGVPENTVWSRLRLGKEALRRKLATDARMVELLGRKP